MIKGIGTDIVAIARIQKLISRYNSRFLTRAFTPAEINYCQNKAHPAQHYAGRFAAKEAFIKALGNSLPFKDIEVERTAAKAPRIKLSPPAQAAMQGKNIFLSISHDHEYAVAQVILE